ncbi:Serine/threonine-protein kinase, active site [Sesbania bispinosa]|nr:Serine/threonine-protein kinase, active site [Sesbania bispinosa]
MARNKFSGTIPKSLGDLASLETLDLSSNNLSGPIPESFEKYEYMVMLNLSFNHLEGAVPMKGVFLNLSRVDLRGKKKRNILLPIMLAVTGATALFISMFCLLWVLMSRKRKCNKQGETNLSCAPFKGLPQNISYGDIRLATNNFAAENLIGKGGFGSVYKGLFSFSINTGETTTLAVKVLDLEQSKASKSFNAECEALRNVRHRNLVKVITSCCSVDYKGDDFKALVMQFMPNEINIAIDVASAMDYLHHDCDPPIVHCDLKPVNVLLDEDMVAHVADFGLARFLSQNQSEQQSSTMGLKGSIGYIAPEASTEGDVYSFGILLLEMFIAKKPTDEMFKEGLSLNKFISVMDENQVLEVADPRLIKEYDEYWKQSFSTDYHSSRSGTSAIMRITHIGGPKLRSA